MEEVGYLESHPNVHSFINCQNWHSERLKVHDIWRVNYLRIHL